MWFDMSLPCKVLCDKNLRRFHFSCLFCRIRRCYYGKLKGNLDLVCYVLMIQRVRKFATLKNLLLRKFVLPIAEFLAN